MGRNLEKTCDVCCKTMRNDNLKRHMKCHEKKPYSIYQAETHKSGTCGEMKNVDEAGWSGTSSAKCTNLNFEKLEKNLESHVDEFDRKIDLGRNFKMIINKYGYNIHALSENMKDALNTYELYGEHMDLKEIIWRGWQNDLREYLSMPFYRKIVWVVGEKGDEGKSFLQSNVRKEFGYDFLSKFRQMVCSAHNLCKH